MMRRAHDLILAHPDEAAGLIQPVLGGGLVDTSVLAQALASQAVAFVTDPRRIEAPTQRMLAYQVELGDFAQAPSTEGLFDPSIHDRVSKP
jgi:ABC-type nitrate/sulfonate/bicarbonate transport system substrate-binding protein